MKRFAKSMVGVTLLEIMLVLAIAAMVIVMSVRYYQSASINQQANAFISQLQALQAAADSLAQGTGTYTGIGSASLVSITGGGTGGMNTAWGTTITISSGASTMTYTVPSMPAAVCTLVRTRMLTNSKWSVPAGCGTAIYTATN